ncbi:MULTISPECIES: chorismate-binding protein [unclassified Clostridium]|uniref:chorismate-binding protein n=1 Tax=unclassified Clostridium TaxID=2614128 RepID=UPI000297D039|nr:MULTISPECIES: chorismate-binding protein [unclassified Clostridium]EKQ58282.1 MAG: glutamine amidotransferase of anthranilate synthase or aminodeoxychorismate synthase [Clostridium sp. Maddingley MBC34-26]
MKILLLDNYDSFTFNVYQYLKEMKNEVICIRNDKISIKEIEEMNPNIIVISPGPGNPKSAGICLDVVRYFKGKISIFGICLGHQVIGEAFGGNIIHAKELYHGKTSKIFTNSKGVFENLPNEFMATRYHSLVIEKKTLPDCFEITCQTIEGEIMGIKHKNYNIEGVQFHPESIMTDIGKSILLEFLHRSEKLVRGDFINTNNSIEDENVIKINEINRVKPIEIKQHAFKFGFKNDFLSIFESIRANYGDCSCTILDSVDGPTTDCGKSYIGVFPQYELIVSNGRMKINTDNRPIYDIFIENFKDQYDINEEDFNLKGRKFSDIYPIISAIFKETKMHDMEVSFSNGLIGVFSYEYLHYIEEISNKNQSVLKFPDIHLKYFSTILQYDKNTSELIVINNEIPGVKNVSIDIEKILVQEVSITDNNTHNNGIYNSKFEEFSNTTKEEFLYKVAKAKHYIKDGDIFQVQIGRRLHLKKNINPFSVYKKLRRSNPTPYMFYWENKDYQLISNSPELQLKVENENVIIRPIAGTSKGKGKTKEEAKILKQELENDPKEQAEHIMLVDLARNDIGRIAAAGSVKVSELMKTEEFSHVYHLISNVEGKVLGKINTMKLFESTFPAGTLTGAPKVRAMEIINELENEERGPYGGAFGFFEFNGNILSSIIIRTILRKGENLYLQASAGIVADSKDYLEWNEIQHKTETIKQVLGMTQD